MKRTTYLGINCAHDASVALIRGDRIITAISEERLTRRKHAAGIPHFALTQLVEGYLSTELSENMAIIINEYPGGNNTTGILEEFALLSHARVIPSPSHHYLHALYAAALSGFPDCAILVADGSGYMAENSLQNEANEKHIGRPPSDLQLSESISIYRMGVDRDLRCQVKWWGEWIENSREFFCFPSIGHLYSMGAQIVFGSWHHAGKLMGLSSFGNPQRTTPKLLELGPDQRAWLNSEWFQEMRKRNLSYIEGDRATAQDLAATIQYEVEALITECAHMALEYSDKLCIVGGAALNIHANTLVRKSLSPSQQVFVPSAPGDSGTAIGAALHGVHSDTGALPDCSEQRESFGQSYDSEIPDALFAAQSKVSWELLVRPIGKVVQDLLEGKIIGLFDGASEFGPRALGHRSILADPRIVGIKDRVNLRIKGREPFRPFSVVILEEHISMFFVPPIPDRYMLFCTFANDHMTSLCPDLVHVDGSVRVQTAPKESVAMIRAVLERFYSSTGCPMLLNTSLNLSGNPIDEAPFDAIETLVSSQLDALYLHNYRVCKV